MHPRRFWLAFIFATVGFSFPVAGAVTGGSGGGPRPEPRGDCIAPAERQALAAALALIKSPPSPHPLAAPASYPFQPIAGTIWQDRFINNFVDLNPTTGILDWDCTGFTYDGHQGHDILLRSFAEQDAGVPVFAALDGTVLATHDGEFDRRTAWTSGAVANYVILDHGGGHRSLYWHMRSNSVAVTVNQAVTAGTQLGLAASSGFSDWPHLHFESQLNNVVYEPYAGACQTNTPSRWANQTPIRREMYLEMFALHGSTSMPQWFPEDPPRKGTFVRTGTFQPIGAWYTLHNQPPNSTWRARYKRPNGTIFFDSNSQNFGNTNAYRAASWWMYWNINPDIAGTWTLEFSVNGSVLVNAPFLVLDSGGTPTNRPPAAVSLTFDPAVPPAAGATFCRIAPGLIEDPDLDRVRYRFQWQVNGTVVRTVTNAAYSDALRKGIAATGDWLSCTLTPRDATTNGVATSIGAFVGAPPKITAELLNGANFRLRWPTNGPPSTLEYKTNLTAAWQTITSGISQSAGLNVITNPGAGHARWFRVRYN